MFWKRKQHPSPHFLGGSQPILSMLYTPAKKAFETMLEILKDAEKYDNEGEKNVSDMLLSNLCVYIEKYKRGYLKDKKSIEFEIEDILIKTERKNKERR